MVSRGFVTSGLTHTYLVNCTKVHRHPLVIRNTVQYSTLAAFAGPKSQGPLVTNVAFPRYVYVAGSAFLHFNFYYLALLIQYFETIDVLFKQNPPTVLYVLGSLTVTPMYIASNIT